MENISKKARLVLWVLFASCGEKVLWFGERSRRPTMETLAGIQARKKVRSSQSIDDGVLNSGLSLDECTHPGHPRVRPENPSS
jgi:hypothetical protein